MSAGRLRTFHCSLLALALCAMAPVSALAFIDPPVLVPAEPHAGELISVRIRSGICDGFAAAPPTITRTGNSIHMLLESLHWGDIILCNITPFTSEFPVGTFPPGTYTLEVERYYENAVPAPVYEVIGNLTFTVQGTASERALPATGIAGSLVLVVGLLGVVLVRRSKRGGLT